MLHLLSRLVDAGRGDFGCGDLRHWQVVAKPTQSNLPHLHSVLPSVLVHVAPDTLVGDVRVLGPALARVVTKSAMTSGRAADVVNIRRMVEFLPFLV